MKIKLQVGVPTKVGKGGFAEVFGVSKTSREWKTYLLQQEQIEASRRRGAASPPPLSAARGTAPARRKRREG